MKSNFGFFYSLTLIYETLGRVRGTIVFLEKGFLKQFDSIIFFLKSQIHNS